MQPEPFDTDIISQVLRGDHNAYATLVERYQNYVFTIVLRYVKLVKMRKRWRRMCL